jgi:ABC-type transport system involved in multi-copper enzyme maturation permease subunit
MLLEEEVWAMIAIPANIPYVYLLLLNTGQAVIAIFLASDFLKRDKKLDTSEVFYVKPLSNAEYVFGKILGNLRVFLLLNLIVMAISIVFTLASPEATVDLGSYLVYFLIISIPTLIYIIGLSIFLMLIFRNQAITFILLLGYIGVTLFYVKDKFYYLFDYMVYSLPLMKSTIVGFPNWDAIITHRAIYLFAGLTCIFITIPLFGRLPNSSKGSYPWIALSICTLLICTGAGYKHVSGILWQSDIRLEYTQINNKYVHTPKMLIDRYDISVKQYPKTFVSETKMTGIALSASPVFTFCLNPGLEINEVKNEDKILNFKREKQILLVDFGKEIAEGDTVSLSVNFGGRLDNSFCYLDIPKEELQKQYGSFLINVDKQYSFQTDEYALFTPETYWYPRPGAGYSDESPDWQQTYFSRFTLNVTPLPGLVPLSQGERIETDGSYSFVPEYPVQAISLAIGNYKQKTTVRDSIVYNIWHLEGHDFFSMQLDSISDTIPSIVQNVKENMERTHRLYYPFKRFSIIETPAQFYSHPHVWSQAQEVVQPEMVFFTEKGWIFPQMNIKNDIKNNRRWAKISHKEACRRYVNNVLSMIFTNSNGNVSFSSNRGSVNVETKANPYFLFPQLFNFRYNIYSSDWPVANRLVELYLQNNLEGASWTRGINGVSNSEKASMLLEKQTFKDLLSDAEHRDLMNNIVGLKAAQLFAPAELNLGVSAFRDSLYLILKENTFNNIQLETILDTLGKISETDILSSMPAWNNPVRLPFYNIGEPELIHVNDRGQDFFVLNIVISNKSGYDGIIQMNLNVPLNGQDENDSRANRKVQILAHQSKQLTSIWENTPGDLTINTMISGNLPGIIRQQTNKAIQNENRRLSEQEADIILPNDFSDNVLDEVIVDNEDSTLFSLSKKPIIGLLPKWLEEAEGIQSKYSGAPSWNPPLQWIATTNSGYYGKYIRSAYVVRSTGSRGGNQTATWKIPVPANGHYELYYHVFKDDRDGGRDRWRIDEAEYKFKVAYGEDIEDAYIRIGKATNTGWEQVGVYYFASDTVSVTLSNECRLSSVIADAVKIVRRKE